MLGYQLSFFGYLFLFPIKGDVYWLVMEDYQCIVSGVTRASQMPAGWMMIIMTFFILSFSTISGWSI